MDLTRRELERMVLAGLSAPLFSRPSTAAPAKPNSKVKGVQIGVQSYSFRDRGLDEAIQAMLDVGLSSCELYSGHVEPRGSGPREPQALARQVLAFEPREPILQDCCEVFRSVQHRRRPMRMR